MIHVFELPYLWIFFPEYSLQAVQRTVGERCGNNSPLGRSFRRFVKDVFLHIPGFQPLLEDGPIRGNVSQEPIVGDLIETAFDIAF
jgi:hypothetical protein